jgi:hypothetical protein
MFEQIEIGLNFIAGFLGAVVHNGIKNNSLVLPQLNDTNFILGFIGCGLTGGAVGMATGNNVVTAFLAGYTGMSLIPKVMPQQVLQPEVITLTPTEIITNICKTNGLDPTLAIKVATCESSLNPNATNGNTNGSIDRGLFQINSAAHPEVTPAQAFDPTFSAQFFCTAYKAGNLSWWDSSKTCWSK